MAKEGGTEYTIKQMQELTNLSYSAVYKLLHGYQSRGTTQSGLLEKCPAISFTDRTVTSDDDVGRSVRRRAHAYQFNLGAYRHWSSGGAVWLGPGNDHDDPDEAGNSADGSTFPETAANIIEGETGVETGNKQFNKKIFINNSTKSGNSENKEPEGPGEGSTPVCVCESESASNEIDHGAFHSPISKIPPPIAVTISCTFRKDAETAANSPILQHISSRDYKMLDIPESRTLCSLCGHKGSEYVEKPTSERKARADRSAIRICKVCYKTARKREQGESPPLPGILTIDRMENISNDIGRCSVCNLEKAVYIDREAGTSICQHCYDREDRVTRAAERGAGK